MEGCFNLMSAKKLSDPVKQEILQLYRETDETTSTLAERYEVSSSTISRFLKTNLTSTEYDELIQQKRFTKVSKTNNLELELSTISEEAIFSLAVEEEMVEPQDNFFPEAKIVESAAVNSSDYFYFEDDDLEDEDQEDDDEWDDSSISSPTLATNINLQVLPLKAAAFPKTCYLVIDRSAELITRPLKDFAQLGKIPSEEYQQKTLPVFDNHKVAKRFSNRSQRVIKVPDGRIFQKASNYLQAKGITRILLDGQIYSLSP